jgi:gliding motility-associated-like protein
VDDLPVISKSNDTSICVNSSATLFASGGSTYNWLPASSLNNDTIANPIASPSSTTTYFITVSTGGCSTMDSVHVFVNPAANISTSNDTSICTNSSTTIFATGGTSYSWSPASSLDNVSAESPVASPSSSTVYHVTITDSFACIYTDSVNISVRQPAVFAVTPDNSVCSKNAQQLNASGGDTYLWQPASFLDNPGISDPIAIPDSTITYTVIINDTTCKQSATLFTKLTVLPSPDVQATSSNDIDCSLPSSQLNATGAITYTWSPVNGLDNFGIANPVASPTATSVYTVTGKDLNGCSNSDTVTVKVNFIGNTVYGLPNSFTPNGDGLNDCFGIKYWGQVTELDFSIYNRLGERVFHTNDPDNCWDGTFKGEPQKADVFVYTIKAKTACANIDKKGTVTLLR